MVLQNNEIQVLDKVLYGELQPWLPGKEHDESFTALLDSYEKPNVAFKSRFEIKFQAPFNAKTIYYNKLIRDEILTTSLSLIELIESAQQPALKTYWLTSTIDKLKTRFTDIARVLKTNDFNIDYIDPRKSTFDLDKVHKSNTFIMQLLKLAFIHLFLEVQETFKNELKEHLSESDIYMRFLHETLPNTLFIQTVSSLTIAPNSKTSKKKEGITKEFHSLRYKRYTQSPSKLTDLCSSLKKGHFISQDTTAPVLKKIFSGEPISKPVEWTGTISDFYYFIKLVHNKHKVIEDLKQKQWKIACQCFVDANGNHFDFKKVRLQQKPKTTYKDLESAVAYLL